MDWGSIGGAALAGAIGGALGGLIGAAVSRLFPDKHRALITTVFVVLFAIVTPRIAEAIFDEPVTAASIETEILADPQFGSLARAWKQADPQSFSSAMTRIESAARMGTDRTTAIGEVRAALLSAATPRFNYLDDHAMLEMIAISRDEYRELAQSLPSICHPMFNGAPFGDITPYLSDDVEQRERALVEAAFGADLSAQRNVLRGAELEAAINHVLDLTGQRVGEDVNLLAPNVNISGRESRYCEVVSEVFGVALTLPPERAAAFMRGLKAVS